MGNSRDKLEVQPRCPGRPLLPPEGLCPPGAHAPRRRASADAPPARPPGGRLRPPSFRVEASRPCGSELVPVPSRVVSAPCADTSRGQLPRLWAHEGHATRPPPFLRGARAASSLPGASSPRVVLDAHAERHPSVRHRLGVKPTPRPPADLQHLPETVPGVTPSGRNSPHGDPSGRSAAFHTRPVSASSLEASVIVTSCKDGLLLLAFDARLYMIKRCLEVILIPSVQPPNTAWLKGLRNLNAIYPLMPSKAWLPVGPRAKDSRGPRPRFPTLFPAEGSRGPLEKRPMASLGQGRAGVPMLCPRARQWTQDRPGGSHWPNAGNMSVGVDGHGGGF